MADLSALLEHEASAEIETLLSEARDRASEIVSEAEREAEALRAGRERAARSQREATLVRTRSAAQLEASSMRLRAQQEAIAEVFHAAEKQLTSLPAEGERYAEILAQLLTEAREGLGDATPETVEAHPDEVDAARAAVEKAGLDATVQPSEDLRTGVRLRSGRITVENTLLQRLESLRDELASEVAEALTSKEA